MAAETSGYYGCYCILDHTSGDSGINVDGNMVSVGRELEWTPELHVTMRGKEVPRVVLGIGNKALGFIPPNVFKHVKECLDEGWTCRAYASLSIFNKLEDRYLVEVAIICYDDAHKAAFDAFCPAVAARIAAGEHPAVALSPKDLARVVESGGSWCGTPKAELPSLKKGSAYYKTKQTTAERVALAAASGNKGCYIGLIIVAAVIIAVVAWLVLR